MNKKQLETFAESINPALIAGFFLGVLRAALLKDIYNITGYKFFVGVVLETIILLALGTIIAALVIVGLEKLEQEHTT